MKFTNLIAASALAVTAPFAASAVTFDTGGISGDFVCNGIFGGPAGNIEVYDGASFNATFDNGDGGGNFCFNLNNNTGDVAAVTLAVATVNQGGEFWGFDGGVTLNLWENATLGATSVLLDLATGVAGGGDWTFLINPGETWYFDWEFGDAYASGFTKPDIDFDVFATPVPLPASALLLLAGVGGLGAMRRFRKS